MVRSPNWIGDCIMSLPALRALKSYFPDAEIGLICREQLEDLYNNISEISRIITISKSGGMKHVFQAVKRIFSNTR